MIEMMSRAMDAFSSGVLLGAAGFAGIQLGRLLLMVRTWLCGSDETDT